MRGRLVFAVLAAVGVVQLAVPLGRIAQQERTLAEGVPWRFETAPVDPADAFRGRYLALRFTVDSAPIPDGVEVGAGEKVFVPLHEDDRGFTALGPVSTTRPDSDGSYLHLRVRWFDGSGVGSRRAHVELPFDRYYLPEELAPEAERVYGERRERPAWVLVRVLDGSATLEELYVDDRPIREHLDPG